MRRNFENGNSNNELSIKDMYLIGYNSLQTLGWLYLGFKIVLYPLYYFSNSTLYGHIGFSLNVFQTLAVLEVFHALVGLVKSNPIITAFQVASRLFVVWGVLYISQNSQQCLGLILLLVAWTITEIIRYSFYVTTILDITPHLLTFLRYTLFYALYPIGVTGELVCVYKLFKTDCTALSFTLPNKLNMCFDYCTILLAVFAAYGIVFPSMYGHMIKQRAKVLGPAPHVKNQ